jgi:hypothetical protein
VYQPWSWARQRLRRRGGVESRVLAEDPLLEAAQLRSGLDPDLLAQRLPGLAVGLEGIGLAPGTVEGEHSLGVEALVQRMLGEQDAEIADHVAMVPDSELGVDRELDRAQPKLLEPPNLRGRERLLGDVGERRTMPELERGPSCAIRGPLLGLAPGSFDETRESRRVDRVAGQLELVPATVGDDLGPAAWVKDLSQPRNVELDVLGGAGGGTLTPEPIDQPIRADRPVGAQREHREHASLLFSSDWERPAVDECIDTAEHANLYGHFACPE